MIRFRRLSAVIPVAALLFGAAPALAASAHPKLVVPRTIQQSAKKCGNYGVMCTEVWDAEAVFGEDNYVGHDEPSLVFYSNQAGSGNRARYDIVLPKEPYSIPANGRSYDFMLHIAPWFGMAMCNPQSAPLVNTKCRPNSDTNITAPGNVNHPGAAYMELQFYPPGYVRQFTGMSCDSRAWCAALVIWSLSQNMKTGQQLNTACQNRVLGGVEYGNFAYITRNGTPQGPPNPLQFDPIRSGAPDPTRVLLMNQGDHVTVTMHDTAAGFRVEFSDRTTGAKGSMTAGSAYGFGQIKFAPSGTGCQLIPYSFHPMYSTSSPRTTVPWAAHTYNVAFSDEIGHFDWCTDVNTATFGCAGQEGAWYDREPSDGDNTFCLPYWASSLVQVSGCLDTNIGFDGASYQPLWPRTIARDSMRPTPLLFSSPSTGSRYTSRYQRVGFESDVPRITATDLGGTCDRSTGHGCTRVPRTDDNAPAAFYPYFTKGIATGHCMWTLGQSVAGFSRNDFGGVSQYGQLLKVTYPSPTGPVARYNDFRRILSTNPC